MNKKKYNSITARLLANKYKLKLINIKSHRQDNKITIKDVQNLLKKLKKIKKKNKFGKLDYIYQHIIIIDGNLEQLSINHFIKTIFNNLENVNKKLIKEPQLYIKDNNNIILKYKISEDNKDKLHQILENINIIFNQKYKINENEIKINENEIKISISAEKEIGHSLDDSDYEIIDSSELTSPQGKPNMPTLIKKPWFKKDNGWDEYDLKIY